MIVATRWDPDDLSAELLKQTGSKYKEIRLPAYAEEGDLLGRMIGEALCPELVTPEDLQELKEGMGTFLFNAIYQQTPKHASSDMFQRAWLENNIVEVLPHHSRLQWYRSWDKASTDGAGDFTAGLRACRDIETNHTYLVDMTHGQWTAGKVEEVVEKTAEADGIETTIIIPQDPGSAGKSVAERYVSDVVPQYAVKVIHHTGDKLVRALPFFAACEHGKVYMLRGPWNDKFIDECVSFTGEDGNTDDQVDAASQYYNHVFSKKRKAGAWGRNRPVEGSKAPTPAQSKGNNIVRGVTWGRR